MTARAKPIRCAIYTRVSTDSGLDQEFNSLDAQYDAASAYIRSQAHARWTLVRTRYDDDRATIFAYNNFDSQFTDWVAFLSISERPTSYTADRREFLGRNGDVSDPAAMREHALPGVPLVRVVGPRPELDRR